MNEKTETFTIEADGVWVRTEFYRELLERHAVLALARRLQLTTVPKWTREPDETIHDGQCVRFRWKRADGEHVEAWTRYFDDWFALPTERFVADLHTAETIDAAVVELLGGAP